MTKRNNAAKRDTSQKNVCTPTPENNWCDCTGHTHMKGAPVCRKYGKPQIGDDVVLKNRRGFTFAMGSVFTVVNNTVTVQYETGKGKWTMDFNAADLTWSAAMQRWSGQVSKAVQ